MTECTSNPIHDPDSATENSYRLILGKRHNVFLIVLTYIAFAGICILWVDKLAAHYLSNPFLSTVYSNYKFSAFVIFSALLLYQLMRSFLIPADKHAEICAKTADFHICVPYGLLSLAILTLTATSIQEILTEQQTKEISKLESIANLKTQLLGDWVTARPALTDDLQQAELKSILHWPIPSASAEIRLYRRNNQGIERLNLLESKDKSALVNLNTNSTLSKALAAQFGNDGQIEGQDMNETPVIGWLKKVPGTDWSLLVLIRRSELLEEGRLKALLIGLTGILAFVAISIGFYMLHIRQQLSLSLNDCLAQKNRLQNQNLLSTIADNTTSVIYATNLEGQYTFFNKSANLLFGQPKKNLLGCNDKQLFPKSQAENRMNNIKTVLNGAKLLNQREVLDTQSGRRIFLSNLEPLRDMDGNIIGTVGVSHDITGIDMGFSGQHDQ